MTFAEDIEREVKNAPIEAVVIGHFDWWPYDEDERRAIPEEQLGRPLTWADARPLLDYDYDTGFGSADCHPVAVYTADRIVSVYQYDGATGFFSLPRNPSHEQPDMPGGG